MIRVLLALSLFISVLTAPWWVSLLIAITLMAVANAVEIVAIGIFADIVLSTPTPSFFNVQFITTISFLLVFVLAYYIKRRLFIYTIQ